MRVGCPALVVPYDVTLDPGSATYDKNASAYALDKAADGNAFTMVHTDWAPLPLLQLDLARAVDDIAFVQLQGRADCCWGATSAADVDIFLSPDRRYKETGMACTRESFSLFLRADFALTPCMPAPGTRIVTLTRWARVSPRADTGIIAFAEIALLRSGMSVGGAAAWCLHMPGACVLCASGEDACNQQAFMPGPSPRIHRVPPPPK